MFISHLSLLKLNRVVVVLPVFLPHGLVVMLMILPLDLPQPEWAARVFKTSHTWVDAGGFFFFF